MLAAVGVALTDSAGAEVEVEVEGGLAKERNREGRKAVEEDEMVQTAMHSLYHSNQCA